MKQEIIAKNNKKIIYNDSMGELYLNLFLCENEKEIFNELTMIGIDANEVFMHSLKKGKFIGSRYFQFELALNGEKIIFKADQFTGKRKIYRATENELSKYYYSKETGFVLDQKIDIDSSYINNQRVFVYEKRNCKKAIKNFFFSDNNLEQTLTRMFFDLGIKPGSAIYVNNFKNNNFKFGVGGSFTVDCMCNDENHTVVTLKCEGNYYVNKDFVTVKNDFEIRNYEYDYFKKEFIDLDELRKQYIKI